MKRFLAILSAVLCLLATSVTTFAEDRVPELPTKSATLTISYQSEKNGKTQGISGAQFAIYQVAGLHYNGGSAEYTTLAPYQQYAVIQEDKDQTYNGLTADASKKLAVNFAAIKGTPAATGTTTENGSISFTVNPSEFGMYLVVETAKNADAANYETVSPFLVSVPTAEGDPLQWNTEVLAAPKEEPVGIRKTSVQKPKKPSTQNGVQTGDFQKDFKYLIMILGGTGALLILYPTKKREE